MVPPAEGKPVRLSRITLAQLMQVEHANNLGFVHGGWIMKLMDEAGALASMRHAQKRVVTVAVDHMTFQKAIRIGEVVTLQAEVSYVGRTSLEAVVNVTSEDPVTGQQTHTNTAYLVYVAIDDHGRPSPVPPLIVETEEEKLRRDEAEVRQAARLARKRRGDSADKINTDGS
jgi:uncharacterized protein (TIGR00369 family)